MPSPTAVKEDQCESCGIFIGGAEEYYIEEYREHNICLHCQFEWQRREKRVGREITWEEFVNGKVKK